MVALDRAPDPKAALLSLAYEDAVVALTTPQPTKVERVRELLGIVQKVYDDLVAQDGRLGHADAEKIEPMLRRCWNPFEFWYGSQRHVFSSTRPFEMDGAIPTPLAKAVKEQTALAKGELEGGVVQKPFASYDKEVEEFMLESFPQRIPLQFGADVTSVMQHIVNEKKSSLGFGVLNRTKPKPWLPAVDSMHHPYRAILVRKLGFAPHEAATETWKMEAKLFLSKQSGFRQRVLAFSVASAFATPHLLSKESVLRDKIAARLSLDAEEAIYEHRGSLADIEEIGREVAENQDEEAIVSLVAMQRQSYQAKLFRARKEPRSLLVEILNSDDIVGDAYTKYVSIRTI